MSPTTDYQIIYGSSIEDLTDKVKAQIEAGWIVQGGMQYANQTQPYHRDRQYFQAMVKMTDLLAQMNTKLGTISSNVSAIKTSVASIDGKTPNA